MASGRNTRNNRRRRKKKKGGNIALFVVEIVILVALAIGVFAYSRINKGLKNLGTEMGDQQQTGAEQTGDVQQAAQPEDMADVVINEGVATNEVLTGYTNIALVGIDTRDGDIDYANSDTMLIASVNNDTWGVRMVSLYRDTYLNMDPENGGWNFNKCNSAYAHGSVHQFLSMLNANLDLNITEYVIVDMKALATLVDDLGGISVILTEEEVGHLNNLRSSIMRARRQQNTILQGFRRSPMRESVIHPVTTPSVHRDRDLSSRRSSTRQRAPVSLLSVRSSSMSSRL